MTEKERQEFRFAVEVEEQELAFYYKGEEWWISRLYGEEKTTYLHVQKTHILKSIELP